MNLFVLIFLAVLMLNGCASSNELELPTTIDMQLQRELRAQAKMEEEAKQEEMKQEEVLKKENELKLKQEKSVTEIIAASKETPPELAFLEFPQNFEQVKISPEVKEKIMKAMKTKSSEQGKTWQAIGTDVYVIAWQNLINADQIRAKSNEDLIHEFEQLGIEFDTFFQQNNKSRASYKVLEGENQIVMIVKSKYLDGEDWYNQVRCVFLYEPTHTTEIMILGKEEDYLKVKEGIDEAIVLFQNRLKQYFPEGFKTQNKVETGVGKK